MRSTELLGLIAGFFIVGSTAPYAVSVWSGKGSPRLVTWVLWALNGLVLLSTYHSSGAKDNIWPTVGMLFNPSVVVLCILIRQHRKLERPNWSEIICIVLSVAAMALYVYVHADPELSQYALYLSIAADLSAAFPTIKGVLKDPETELPFSWLMLLVGELISFGSITEHTVANYSLRVYVAVLALTIFIPSVRHRVHTKTPLREWI